MSGDDFQLRRRGDRRNLGRGGADSGYTGVPGPDFGLDDGLMSVEDGSMASQLHLTRAHPEHIHYPDQVVIDGPVESIMLDEMNEVGAPAYEQPAPIIDRPQPAHHHQPPQTGITMEEAFNRHIQSLDPAVQPRLQTTHALRDVPALVEDVPTPIKPTVRTWGDYTSMDGAPMIEGHSIGNLVTLVGHPIPGAPGKWREPFLQGLDAWTLAIPLSDAREEVLKRTTDDCQPWEVFIRAAGEFTERIRFFRGFTAQLDAVEALTYARFLADGFSPAEAASTLFSERISRLPAPEDAICLDAVGLVRGELDGIDEGAVCPAPCELDSICFWGNAYVAATNSIMRGNVRIERTPPEPFGVTGLATGAGKSTGRQFRVTSTIALEKVWSYRIVVRMFCAEAPPAEAEQDF